MCPCSMYKNTTYTPEELDSRIKEIKEALTVNRKETSVHKRSLISAPDERLSVKRIGYVGVSIMAALCVLIVLMDMPRSISCLKDFLRQCK
ncbi:hypothetical protein FSP39_012768 [Pinctada imbricata]|uniref:Uncharacterized protein n=1 Tax=Pinctada imbricata TaxID=66713 RepID=A0AA89C6C7_PINIB|nr:hypothetical protein FSP39_012768 [Pinctada imbricata]